MLIPIQIIIEDKNEADEVQINTKTLHHDSHDGTVTIDIEVQEETIEVQDDDDRTRFEYSIKIVSPSRMSEFKKVRVCKWKRCRSLDDLRSFLSSKVPSVDVNGEEPDFAIVDLGYIEPGHGVKGMKHWLNNDDDIDEMYTKHVGKRNILLWAYSHIKNPGKKGESNFEAHKKSLIEVDEKYDELRKKHGTKYTLEQLRMWAHMIRLGKHESTDKPPDKPFWCGRKRQCAVSEIPKPVKKTLLLLQVHPLPSEFQFELSCLINWLNGTN